MNLNNLFLVLPLAAKGILGIFIVTFVIIVTITIINKAFEKNN